ncbi:MAG TPA: SAF domain-containing protein [Thermoclostridium sp.]
MAFFRKRKMFSVLAVIFTLTIILLLLSGLYYLYQKKLAQTVETYEDELEQLKFDLYSLNRRVYVPKQDIPFGTVLTQDMFDIVEMKLDFPQARLFDESDIGKVNTVFLPSGAPVFKTSVAEEKLDNDLREQEFNMFYLQSNQKKGDFVDVRIFFPNGENYIVLSKKQIKDIILEENTVRLWLDESEIHNISSAIIDAYIHPGTKIYVATYIMPELQEAAVPFYAANENVLDLMRKDPNIVEKASDALARELRASLESNLSSVAKEDISKVTTGVNEEISKNKELIQSQEAPRDKTGEKVNFNRENTEVFN